MATSYPGINAYNFVMGNPIMAIDPDGNDWIFNLENCKYEWNDNVTSGTDLHGTNMRYVGANDRDVLLDLGWTEENKSLSYKSEGFPLNSNG